MKELSIESNAINYVQNIKNPTDCYKLDVKALKPKNQKRIYKCLAEEDRQVILELGKTPIK